MIFLTIIFPDPLDCTYTDGEYGTTNTTNLFLERLVKWLIINKHVFIFSNMSICTVINIHRINSRFNKINKGWCVSFYGLITTIKERFISSSKSRQGIWRRSFMTGTSRTNAWRASGSGSVSFGALMKMSLEDRSCNRGQATSAQLLSDLLWLSLNLNWGSHLNYSNY